MKCKACNGTGKIKVIDFAKQDWKDTEKVCTICCGTGIIKQTNEEWLRSCTTEQLAEWLRGVYWHCHEIDCKHCNYPWRCMEKGDIVEWLKQPRTDKE